MVGRMRNTTVDVSLVHLLLKQVPYGPLTHGRDPSGRSVESYRRIEPDSNNRPADVNPSRYVSMDTTRSMTTVFTIEDTINRRRQKSMYWTRDSYQNSRYSSTTIRTRKPKKKRWTVPSSDTCLFPVVDGEIKDEIFTLWCHG